MPADNPAIALRKLIQMQQETERYLRGLIGDNSTKVHRAKMILLDEKRSPTDRVNRVLSILKEKG